MQRNFILFGFVLLFASACGVFPMNTIIGNGNVQEESREIADFTAIDLAGISEVNLRIGTETSLIVIAEENILPEITTEVADNTLTIDIKDGVSISPSREIRIEITTLSLEAISLSGAGNLTIPELETENLTISLSGVGNIQISELESQSLSLSLSGAGNASITGNTTEQNISLSGIGNYEAANLVSNLAIVDISGAGSATLRVSEELSGSLSGIGSINYYGNPTITVDRSGLGSIEQASE